MCETLSVLGQPGGRSAFTQFRGEIEQVDASVGSGDAEPAFREFDVRDGGLEHMRRRIAPGLNHQRARLDDRRAARHQRFRAARAAARDQFVAVALLEPDALEGDAELADENLREGRRMALSIVERPGDDRDIAVLLEADAAHLVRRGRGDLEILPNPPAA